MPVVNRRGPTTEQAVAAQRTGVAMRWSRHHDPLGIIKLARDRSKAAILKLERLMNGDAGKMKVLDKNGERLIEVDIEVPAAVQAKCAELIIERGYGKSPQAILIQDDTPEGRRMLTTAEKITAIQQARTGAAETTDLEASEIIELPLLTAPSPTPTPEYKPEDLI